MKRESASAELSENFIKAAIEFDNRQSRRTHPAGSFDKSGRFYVDELQERRPCCFGIREPTRAYPYSYMTHCRSLAHVAQLHGLTAEETKLLRKHHKAILAVPRALGMV